MYLMVMNLAKLTALFEKDNYMMKENGVGMMLESGVALCRSPVIRVVFGVFRCGCPGGQPHDWMVWQILICYDWILG